jgi:hypothetical protein
MQNSSILQSVLAAALLLVLCQPVRSESRWRSQLYPTNWEPPASTRFTERMLQDWSYAGAFEGRPIPLKAGPVFDAVSYGADPSGSRDSTDAIQRAIDAAGATGGVVYLPGGTYCFQTADGVGLRLRHGNVVLRGAGVNKTFLLNTTTNMRGKVAISLGHGTRGGWDEINSTPVKLSGDVVTPTNRIPVESTNGFSAGDHIVLATSLTSAFINEVGMSGIWQEGDNDIKGVMFSRTITNVEPGVITVDTPVRFYLKTRDNARAYHTSAIIENSGIEDLSIANLQHGGAGFGMTDYNTPGTGAYNVHGSRFVDIHRARNVWMKDVATYRPAQNTKDVHILSNAVRVRDDSHVTLKNVNVSHPEYRGEGGNGYGFQLDGQETLLQDCTATYQRHGITFSGMQSSGNVVHRCTIAHSKETPNGGGSDFHRFLSQSNLIDNLTVDTDFFNARYRPNGSPTHGITATQTVFYNTKGIAYHPARPYILASAQAFQGYIIGTSGAAPAAITPEDERSGGKDWLEGEGAGSTLTPVSLYASQVAKRNRILSVDRITTSSLQPKHPAEHTVDNDLSTWWSAEGDSSWIMYDLGEDHTVNSIGIAFYKGVDRVARVYADTSLDEITWTSPLILEASGASNDSQRFDLSNRRARYVRITSLGNTQDNSSAITEVDIYRF